MSNKLEMKQKATLHPTLQEINDVKDTFEMSGTKPVVFPQNSFLNNNRFGRLPKPSQVNTKTEPTTHTKTQILSFLP